LREERRKPTVLGKKEWTKPMSKSEGQRTRHVTSSKKDESRQPSRSSANLEVKRAILNTKKDLLDKVYDEALEALAALSESEREAIIKRLLESHTDSKRVFSNTRDESIVRRITNLEYGGMILCSGGIVLENEDGTVIHDLTFDTLLESVRETSLKQLLEILNV
jgi:V/A-type H+-transporting ATPase subunit E